MVRTTKKQASKFKHTRPQTVAAKPAGRAQVIAQQRNPFVFVRDWQRLSPLWYVIGIVFAIADFSIGFLNLTDRDGWQVVAFIEGSFAFTLVPIYFLDRKYAKPNVTGLFPQFLQVVLLFFVVAIAQQISSYNLTITNLQYVLYFNGAAILEELLFRGLVCRGIAGNKNNPYRLALAVIVSTAGFAAMHVNYYAFFPAMVFVVILGAVCSLVMVLWKNLPTAIIIHLLNNLFVSAPVWFQVIFGG